ncbi:hypothetical protein NUT40_13460 [Staphylococcus saprophyticus]|nr:hypothetical protein NUT40_13460 [Staphylococcus saprophyticus]
MYEEFVKIAQIIKQKNNDLAAQKLEHSIQVIEVLEQALDSANIKVGSIAKIERMKRVKMIFFK